MWKFLFGTQKSEQTQKDSIVKRKPSEIIRERAAERHGVSGEYDEKDLLEQVKATFHEAKQRFERCQSQGSTARKYDLTILGVGTELLAFGELDVLEDILNHVPPDDEMRRRYAFYFPTLLPLPENLEVWSNPGPTWTQGIREWYKANKYRLFWSEEQGQFILKE